MNIDQAFPSDYLKAADLQNKKHKVTMSHVENKEFGTEGDKPVLFFAGREKGLVLNKTNARMISSEFGSETEEWQGKDVVLFPTKVPFNGQMVDAIRVELVMEMATESTSPALDDDIPF